jgi:hypothetical protein
MVHVHPTFVTTFADGTLPLVAATNPSSTISISLVVASILFQRSHNIALHHMFLAILFSTSLRTSNVSQTSLNVPSTIMNARVKLACDNIA